MLCLTTTRIILGFICFGPICFTGRPGHQQLLSATPCFDQKSHKAADESGCTSNCSCLLCTYHCGCSSALVLALKGPMVPHRRRQLDDGGALWRSPPLLSSQSSDRPPLPNGMFTLRVTKLQNGQAWTATLPRSHC